MFHSAKKVASPIISQIILIIGNGFFLTFVSLRMKMEGMSTEWIGLATAMYFGGLTYGSLKVIRLIDCIGHIRSYAVLAAIVAVTVILHGLFLNSWAWLFLRFFNGYGIAGLFVTIESWLLVQSDSKEKGRILSLYMLSFYGAQTLGQFLLNFTPPNTYLPFAVTATFATFSIIPVSMTKVTAPEITEHSFLKFRQLFSISPIGVIGAFLSGIFLGALYGLLPIFAQSLGLTLSGITGAVGMTILGGLLAQCPIGVLSDKFDRRKILLLCSLTNVLLCLLIIIFSESSLPFLLILSFFFGAMTFPLYPLSISHTTDNIPTKDFVAASGALNILNGAGAIIGPTIASFIMTWVGKEGLFVHFMITGAILGGLTFWRILKKPPITPEKKKPYVILPKTTPMASELDPRGDKKN